MYVCLCMGVTDREIRAAISEGASSVEEVAFCTGAGTRCGSCLPTVDGMLTEAAEAEAPCPSRRRLMLVRPEISAA